MCEEARAHPAGRLGAPEREDMNRQGFDNQKYLETQSAHIRERIDQFGGKLYLEFGGKLFDDYHASRVLPGFAPDSKIRMLLELRESVEIVISIAAGVTLHDLRDAVQGRCHVVRVMPNTPALVGAGVFGIQEDPALPKNVFAMILDLFGLLGSTIVLPEKKFNAFMALVGCGPAYVFHFMDALAEAGVTMGFTRQEALELVTQLVLGSAKLAVLPGSHPAILREQVCSPAGVTIAAVNHLDRTAVRGHLIDAVLAAYAKS